jgi:hypothetical protein
MSWAGEVTSYTYTHSLPHCAELERTSWRDQGETNGGGAPLPFTSQHWNSWPLLAYLSRCCEPRVSTSVQPMPCSDRKSKSGVERLLCSRVRRAAEDPTATASGISAFLLPSDAHVLKQCGQVAKATHPSFAVVILQSLSSIPHPRSQVS